MSLGKAFEIDNFGKRSFRTARLLLRPVSLGDVGTVQEAVEESRASLAPWLAWARPEYTQERCREHLRILCRWFEQRRAFVYHGFSSIDGQFVLSVGLRNIRWEESRMELSYWCRESLRGQGYAYEAAETLSEVARESFGVKRLEILCGQDNLLSRRLAVRLGFRLEAGEKTEPVQAGLCFYVQEALAGE